MKLNMLPIIATLLFLVGCTSGSEPADQASKSPVHQDDTAVAEPAPTELALNNGEKWPVNPEMMVHVAASDSLLQNFDASAPDSHTNLAKALEDEKNRLISTCTMKGPAHDALHLWLLPYIDHIEDLAKAQSEDEEREALADLRQSFDAFNSYFE